MPEVLILSGPAASGKTSVALSLADRYDRVAHVPLHEVHAFMTPTGHVHPWGNQDAWKRQETILVRGVCALARSFLEGRFAVIIEHPVMDAATLALYVAELRSAGVPVHHIRLMPSLEVCLARNQRRTDVERLSPGHVKAAYAACQAVGAVGGWTIESGDLAAVEVADRVQALTTSGSSLVWRPGKD